VRGKKKGRRHLRNQKLQEAGECENVIPVIPGTELKQRNPTRKGEHHNFLVEK
jgi:hypothetical protein